jgi:hypothetical protein
MQKNNSQVKKGIGILGAFAGAALYIAALTGCPLPQAPVAPTISFQYNGTTYNNSVKNEISMSPGQAYTLTVTANDEKEILKVYEKNGTTVDLTDTNTDPKVFEGTFQATAPKPGDASFSLVAQDIDGLETILPVTIKAPDVTPPSKPSNFAGSAQGSGEIRCQWTESSDDVGVVQYQMKISPYNLPNPLAPLDAGDISDVASMPAPVSPSTTLEKLVGSLEVGVKYSVYIRAGDGAGNWSGWEKLNDIESGGIPPIPYDVFGQINSGTIPDGRSVSAKDKYNNVLNNGVTISGWYDLLIANRKTGMTISIVCQDYGPTGSATIKSGVERIDF